MYIIYYIYIGNIGYKHGMSTFSLQATLVSYCLMGETFFATWQHIKILKFPSSWFPKLGLGLGLLRG